MGPTRPHWPRRNLGERGQAGQISHHQARWDSAALCQVVSSSAAFQECGAVLGVQPYHPGRLPQPEGGRGLTILGHRLHPSLGFQLTDSHGQAFMTSAPLQMKRKGSVPSEAAVNDSRFTVGSCCGKFTMFGLESGWGLSGWNRKEGSRVVASSSG